MPYCGTLYLYTYDCGLGENDITLRRATRTEAGLETDIEDCRKELASAHDETRGYGAQCLTEHSLGNGNLVEVEALLAHPEEVIRSHAEAPQRFHLYQKQFK